MEEVNIFLGSSKDLMFVRKRIGRIILQLNEEWYDKGVRIHLKIWENFRTEYEDMSKQDEYINELVLPSQLCIFLYDEHINPYTEKELDAKVSQDISAVVVYHICNKDGKWNGANEEKRKLEAKHLTPIDIKDLDCLEMSVNSLVEEFIKSNGLENSLCKDIETKYLYTTLPDDLKSEKDSFIDTLRDLSDLSEDCLNIRCRLWPLKSIGKLALTDHYIPLMKKHTSSDDITEFSTALELQHESPHNRPAITLFTKGPVHKPETNKTMASLLDGKDLFTVSVKNFDTVKWRLLCWLLNIHNDYVASYDFDFISCKNRYVYCDGKPIAPIDAVDVEGKVIEIENKIASLRYDLQKIQDTEANNKAIDRINRTIHFLNSELKLHFCKVVNDWILKEINIPSEDIETVGIEELETATDIQQEILNEAIDRGQKVINDWRNKILSMDMKVADLEEKLQNNVDSAEKKESAEKIKDLLLKKEVIQRKLVKTRNLDYRALLATQMYMVGLFDTYINGDLQLREEDELYLRIINDADEREFKALAIETARMNYGNALCRSNQIQQANKIYAKAIENVNKFNDGIAMVRNMKMHLYISMAHSLMAVNMHSNELKHLIDDIRNTIDRWESMDIDCLKDQCNLYSILIKCNQGSIEKTQSLISEAEAAFKRLNGKGLMPVDDEGYNDIACYFPLLLSCYYIDRFEGFAQIGKGNEAYKKAERYCKTVIDNAGRMSKTDRLVCMSMKSKAYHNLGFLDSKCYDINHFGMALMNYEKAYCLRKQIYELTNYPEDLLEIAETSVNIGGLCYISLETFNAIICLNPGDCLTIEKAISYSDEAIKIYSCLLRKGEEESEVNLFKAIQLKGSLLYIHSKIYNDIERKGNGLELLQQAYQWHKIHPLNSYRETFEGVAGDILMREGLIK